MDRLEGIIHTGFIVGSLFLAAGSICEISEYISQKNAVRQAVYAKAQKITPEVITNANEMAKNIGSSQLYTAALGLTCGVYGALVFSTRKR